MWLTIHLKTPLLDQLIGPSNRPCPNSQASQAIPDTFQILRHSSRHPPRSSQTLVLSSNIIFEFANHWSYNQREQYHSSDYDLSLHFDLSANIESSLFPIESDRYIHQRSIPEDLKLREKPKRRPLCSNKLQPSPSSQTSPGYIRVGAGFWRQLP